MAPAPTDPSSPPSPSAPPVTLLRSAEAAQPRTLIDILSATAELHPEAAAIDDGQEVLTYTELLEQVHAAARRLADQGVGRGDRVGIRMSSGHRELYISILGILAAGAAYVPVDADDPDERAHLVFTEAQVCGVLTDAGFQPRTRPGTAPRPAGLPTPDDDAWIIFTSGSTGTPKGVAITHRSAAAFVDGEASWFLLSSPGGPLGPDDRVLAGLSVAFDASCEEMWLAWGNGACLVPAPRSLVRSGMDLGPWLIRQGITVVSTVPTLVGLWPDEALAQVRLLILGGEACPQDVVDRLATDEREVWNTYGPTEATVVSCGARLHAGETVTIGEPLAGWDLAVVDPEGHPVPDGEVGELLIGGVGLGRYLDPAKDAEKYAPAPQVGWERAYRSGDHVRVGPAGIEFVGRIDDQVKIGGRRIELGEVDSHVAALPEVRSSAVVVRTTPGGENILVAYVSLHDPEAPFDPRAARETLAQRMPAPMVPRLAVLDSLPVTTSGKVDTRALPWPLPASALAAAVDSDTALTPTESWLSGLWSEILSCPAPTPDDDFFSLGGTSLAAAGLIARIRERYPTVSVRDLYDRPRLGALAEHLAGPEERALPAAASAAPSNPHRPTPQPVAPGTRLLQTFLQVPLMTLRGLTFLTWLLVISQVAAALGAPWAYRSPWWLIIAGLVLFASPLGRVPLGALGARLLTHGIRPGTYPRGGRTHLRIWAAERWADASGSRGIAGATWVNYYAKLLGARVGKGVDLHSLPPVTGMLSLGKHCSVEPEVDLRGYWLDGDELHVGPLSIGANARVGTRCTLLPHASIGADAHLEAGSTLTGEKPMKKGARWAGSPARKVGRSRHRFPEEHPPRRTAWVWAYGATSVALAVQPLVSVGVGVAVTLWLAGGLSASTLAWAPLGALLTFATSALNTLVGVRLLSWRLTPGVSPVRSLRGWRLWAIQRLMDEARTTLFPLYAGMLTPWWMRALGAKVGRNVEVSTAILIPALTEVKDGAFLADDTLIGGYELGGGWILAGDTTIGKRSFVGNSGITLPGRKLRKNSLVAVQSSTPRKAKAGTNWWGSPPERMRRVEVCADDSHQRTYQPSLGLRVARGAIETLRLLAIMASGCCLALAMLLLFWILSSWGVLAAALLSGVVLMLVGAVAMALTVLMKWVCVGRHRPGEHPLYSPFVWLNELQDTFVETVAAPWFFQHSTGTEEHNVALRALGATVGRGAWVESYWLPETDLCVVGAGATIGPGTVVQTHLFHDRVMSVDTVCIEEGATLGAHSVALPASRLGQAATIMPGSLVMRGDQVPAGSRWQGNPIEPVVGPGA